MKIYPVVFSFEKDFDFICLQRTYIKKFNIPVEEHTLFLDRNFCPSILYDDYLKREGIRRIVRPDGFVPWPSLEHCLCKVGAYRRFLDEVKPKDEDYILDIDSDAFLLHERILGYFGRADLIGFYFTNRQTWVERFRRPWSNIMGSFMGFRVSAVRKMLDLSPAEVRWAQDWLTSHPPFGLAHDMYLPFLMVLSGASSLYPDSGFTYVEGPEAEVILVGGGKGYCVAHLYGDWKSFAGYAIKSKYEIPGILRKIGAV